ncbi:oligogalacturonate-specific porin KdgM family protein [Vibrio sp. McD22-P3]|uniref:oligogalacturonate-specific porin KdgM family protein n=1 Tax=Vibrio sp. McD22-P3 TaxID=2724880 RepID=UPI001F3327B9|nr:oligogalacturonate-specific porin KdgM family protein [Vibrio sp. McD22-P3]MCF4176859.1 oligogalacturonate-specific porin KdgM family protein [Vibrio sp. McD22-P3]
MKIKTTFSVLSLALLATSTLAAENQVASVSAGIGFDNYGASLKMQYEKNSESNVTKGIMELKGIAGSSIGWSNSNERDDSIDSFRARFFSNNASSGIGGYLDTNYDVEKEAANVSGNISFLYKYHKLEVLPYAGLGLSIVNGELPLEENGYPVDDDHVTGYTMPGSFGQVGIYFSYDITDKLNFTYNPEYRTTLGGSESYVNNYFDGDSYQFYNEVRLGYRINQQWDMKYHIEWYSNQSDVDAINGVEINYHF